MGLVADKGSNYTPPPPGTYRAVCTGIVDMGTQVNQWGAKHVVLLTWDIDEHMDDGTRYRVHGRYTVSLHEKSKLRAVLQSWRGRAFTDDELRGFDLRAILGKPCMIAIIHHTTDSGTYANIASVSALPKGMEPLPPTSPPVCFDIDAPDEVLLATFSDRLQENIRSTPEWAAYKKANGGATDEPHHDREPGEDDLPF